MLAIQKAMKDKESTNNQIIKSGINKVEEEDESDISDASAPKLEKKSY